MRLEDQNKAVPSVGSALLFRSKALAFQVKRAARGITASDPRRHPVSDALIDANIIAESRTPLWNDADGSERVLTLGKIHNLRLAIQRLHGVEVPRGSVFSFWKQIGRTSRHKGYVAGRELREGCLVASIGGGLCQLSNALYDAALQAGCEIVERHAHSKVVPGSLAEIQRDATVFWNYVDLRFLHADDFRIEAELTAESLVVRFRARTIRRRPVVININARRSKPITEINSCTSCDATECFRHVGNEVKITKGHTAFLLDEYWPEFDRYISNSKQERDLLCVPLDGRKYEKSNYAWTTDGFGLVKQSRFFALRRAYESRKSSAHGAARQAAALQSNEKLAARYATRLAYEVTHVTVMQNLLPYLWRQGHLTGRTFDVLMTRLPLANLQNRLDTAFQLHPESPTLSDFRANPELVASETAALARANRIITPHTEIAALFPEKSVLVDWVLPRVESIVKANKQQPARIVFPAATLGRKGVYELREALSGLEVELALAGPILERKDFWKGVRVRQLPRDVDWLESATAVVLPSFVEHNPRRLLEALARGVPVIASEACGLGNVGGVTTVDTHGSSLRDALMTLMGS
ncbi:MAG TPA: VanW family protein [Pyrinomonadaceae bacterium]|nr:VanW family protein [Pyrinomonadaceae bacterium]